MGTSRGAWVLTVGGLLAAGSAPGCFILRCDDSFHGVDAGDRFTSTILGRYAEDTLSTSCGDIGDLPADATLTWTAHPDGPGDGCDSELRMEVHSLSTGAIVDNQVTLANGCHTTWGLTAHAIRDDADFRTNSLEEPRWYIHRFLTSASADCYPDGTPFAFCSDSFIATSVAQ